MQANTNLMSSASPALRDSLQRIAEHPVYRFMAWSLLAYVTYLLLIPDPFAAARMLEPLQETVLRGYGLHFLAYFSVTFAILTCQAFRPRELPLTQLGCLVFHGWLTELGQHWVAGRTTDLLDAVTNTVAIALAAAVYGTLCRVLNAGLTPQETPSIIEGRHRRRS